jgi:hypothetical protein
MENLKTNSHQRFCLSDFERQKQRRPFMILVPGGGVEPPRGCPRRILSPKNRLSAPFRTLPHRAEQVTYYQVLMPHFSLARDRTKAHQISVQSDTSSDTRNHPSPRRTFGPPRRKERLILRSCQQVSLLVSLKIEITSVHDGFSDRASLI